MLEIGVGTGRIALALVHEIRRAADSVRAWLPARFGSAGPIVPAPTSWGWHAYDVPG